VLEVAVHSENEFALTVVEAGGEGGGLAEIPAQLHHNHSAVDSGNLLEEQEGVVLAAIVDENQFEGLACGFHDDFEPVVQFSNILFFVVKRYNNGILEHDALIIPFGAGQNANFGPNGVPKLDNT